jgi:hypothetical protein
VARRPAVSIVPTTSQRGPLGDDGPWLDLDLEVLLATRAHRAIHDVGGTDTFTFEVADGVLAVGHDGPRVDWTASVRLLAETGVREVTIDGRPLPHTDDEVAPGWTRRADGTIAIRPGPLTRP